MKSIKNIALLPLLAVVTFLLGYLYVLGDEFARGWAFFYVINLTIIVPFIFAIIIGYAVGLVIGEKSMRTVAGLICGAVGAYANLVWSVHGEFGIWAFGLGDLISAMRMIADMHEIRILFIPFAGMGLVFAYWLEAIVIVFGSMVAAMEQDEKKTKTEAKGLNSSAKTVIGLLLIFAMSTCLVGCSKDEDKPIEKPDRDAAIAWAQGQKWEAYETGWTAAEANIAGKVTVFGIGVSNIPSSPKLIEPNQKRTLTLAFRALTKKVDIESMDGVVSVVNDDFDLPGVGKRRVVVLARVK